ncbi:acyltransferase family protein [Meridianimarinicoccus sp. RP-17]|uniref:acyltransferase family protein n=1 Tax=Meridianimarinicoccus zhengii TaxID=2056810 RepID=UPI000DAE49CD|nr:acyltransferase family protein [Phycocomes zhengii]
MSLRYRPEIDGLRTVAVVSVLIYHLKVSVAGLPVLPGGFLGVDVFFVISGFLIARIIHAELDRTGRFSIADFYERRARRLLPALFAVIFASAAVASFVLVPSAMIEFVRSSLASIAFVSNIYWFFESQQYGARSGLVQPLLHTWSLAVEEQFYLVFPGLFLLGLRFVRRWLVPAGVVGIVLGLILAEMLTRLHFPFSFYWLFSRVWELLAGVLLAHVMVTRPGWRDRVPGTGALPALGLLMIAAGILFMPLGWHHPGIGTVPAVLGTVLVIGFARPGAPVTRLLSSRGFVGIGLISYSLYLWHYPVYAFGRILRPEPGVWDMAAWLALSFALAAASYRLVERPFRDRAAVPLPRLAWSGLAATGAVVAFAAVMLATDGLRARLPGLIAIYGENEFDNAALRDASWGPLAALAAAQGHAGSNPSWPSAFERDVGWFDPDAGTRNILLVGNSHSKDMFNVLHLAADRLPGHAFARYGMNDRGLAGQLPDLFAAPNFAAADVVVLSFRFQPGMLAELPALIDAIAARGKQVAILLNTEEFRPLHGRPPFDAHVRDRGGLDVAALNALGWQMRDRDRVAPLNARLRAIAAAAGIPVLARSDFICDAQAETCDLATPDGRKAFYDGHHYTLEGASHFADRVVATGWLDALDR